MRSHKTAWKHIRRSPYQALAAVLLMTLTFLTLSVFAFIIFESSTVIRYFESKPQVSAFFKDDAKQQDIDTLKNNLEKTGEISSLKYVSKQQALQIYQQQNKNDQLLLDLVTADILPASFEISTVKLQDLTPISQILAQSPVVSEVVYQKDVVSALTTWTNAIQEIGFAVIIILAVVSIIIMMTIIGFKISQKREEIEIMKLLSATNWYIRWPFVLEGMFYGLVGAVIGWMVASAVLIYSTSFLQSFLHGIPLLTLSPVFLTSLLAGELFMAALLGAFASSLAVLRYLK